MNIVSFFCFIGEMTMKKTFLCLALSACCVPPAFCQGYFTGSAAGEPGSNPFTDPAFQDYLQVTDGSLAPALYPKPSDLRDSPASAPAPSLKTMAMQPAAPAAPKPPQGYFYKVTFAGEAGPISSVVPAPGSGAPGVNLDYVYVRLQPREAEYMPLVRELSSSCGFRFAGEQVARAGKDSVVYVLGFVPSARLERVYSNPGVLKVALDKSPAGSAPKTRVEFTLKIPCLADCDSFIASFMSSMGRASGFSAEGLGAVPAQPGSKFSAYSVSGTIEADKVGELLASPFVAGVRFPDSGV